MILNRSLSKPLYIFLWLSTGLGTVSVLASIGTVLRVWTVAILAIIILYAFRARFTDKVNNLPFVVAVATYCFVVFVSGVNAEDAEVWIRRCIGTTTLGVLAISLSQIRSRTTIISGAKWISISGGAFALLAIVEIYLSISNPDIYELLHKFDIDSNPEEKRIGALGLTPRARGYFVEPNEFSQYLLLPLGVLLGIGLTRTNHAEAVLTGRVYMGLLILLILAQFASLSRGGFLGLAIQLVALWFVKKRLSLCLNRRSRNAPIVIFSILAFVLLIPIVFISRADDGSFQLFDQIFVLIDRFSTTGGVNDPTMNLRLSASIVGLEVWLSDVPSLFIGQGAGNLYLTAVDGMTTSNLVVDILAETGIIGLLSFFSILNILLLNLRGFIIFYTKGPRNSQALGPAIGFFLATVGLIFGGLTYSTHNLFLTWISFGLLAAATSKNTYWHQKYMQTDGSKRSATPKAQRLLETR